LLFRCIQDGQFSFPETEWGEISAEAQDLVRHLLVRDPQRRYTADQVLEHPWIHMKKMLSKSLLATPHILSRTNSVRELGLFAENANAVNRLIQRHMSINEVRTHSTRDVLHDDEETTTTVDDAAFLEGTIFQLSLSDDEGEDRGIGIWSEDESDRSWANSSSQWKGISLPGSSKLARRRQEMRHRPSVDSIDSGHLSSCSPPHAGFSPLA
jgi:serine/threonine protein kinase